MAKPSCAGGRLPTSPAMSCEALPRRLLPQVRGGGAKPAETTTATTNATTATATGSQRATFGERLFADDLPRLAAQHALLVVVAVGTALGLRPAQRWWAIDAPLALPVILAGVKTAAVIAVGTATIAAFIGAGGFGERITIGLALNDHAMLLAGALPAAAMASFTQGLFEAMAWSLRRRSRERA
jgi:hypothetical protein